MGIADVLGLAGTVAENWRNANDARRASYLYELEREQAARLDALRQLELQQDVYGNAPPDIGAVSYAPGQDFIEVAQQQQMMQNALANAGAPTAVPLAPVQQVAGGTPQTASLSSLPQGKPDYGAGTYTPTPDKFALDDPRLAKAAMDTVSAVDAKKGVQDIMASGRPYYSVDTPSKYATGAPLIGKQLSQGQQDTVAEANDAIRQLNESEYMQAMRDISDYQRQFNAGASPATLRRNGARAKYEAAVETLNRLNAPAAQSDEKPAPLPVVYPAPQDTQQAAQDPLAAVMQMVNGGQQAAPAPAPAQVQGISSANIGASVTLPSGTKTILQAPPPVLAQYGPLIAAQGFIESRFNPKAVSPKDATGLMQVLPSTAVGLGILERAGVARTGNDAQDNANAKNILLNNPALNAELGAQYMQSMVAMSGGDVVEGLMRYNWGPGNVDRWVANGRDPSKVPPETRNYVRDVTAVANAYAGSQAFPNMPAPLPGVEQVAPSIAEQSPAVQMDRSQFYLANPASVPRDLQVAVQQRQDMARMANLYRQAGLGHEYMQAAMQVRAADQQIVNLQGMQGISELTFANDPRRLSAIWSQYAGTPVQVVPRSDGKWDIRVNGQTTQQGKTTDEVVKVARSMVDQSYNAAMTKEQLEWQKAVLDNQTKVQMEHIKGQYSVMNNDADNLRELQKQAMSDANSMARTRQEGVNTLGNTWFNHLLQAQQPRGGQGASVHTLSPDAALIKFDPSGASAITPQTDANGNTTFIQQNVVQRPSPM